MFCSTSAETGRLKKAMGQFKPFIYVLGRNRSNGETPFLVNYFHSLGHNGEYEFLKLHSCGLQARENTKIPTFDIKLTQ